MTSLASLDHSLKVEAAHFEQCSLYLRSISVPSKKPLYYFSGCSHYCFTVDLNLNKKVT